MFQGFDVEPKGGMEQIPRFCELLEDVICNTDEHCILYMWSWLMHLIQKPWEKPGVAIVLRSDQQGVGKSNFVNYIGKLLGRHFLTVHHQRHLVGNFNALHATALLIFADEAVSSSRREDASVLKAKITEPFEILENKGRDPVQIHSCSRVIIATNESHAAPIELDDRRYFVNEVNPSKKSDRKFFEALIHERDNGGAEALLNCLMQGDLDDFDVSKFPETEARKRQKLFGMKPIYMWWYEKIKSESPVLGTEYFEMKNQTVYHQYAHRSKWIHRHVFSKKRKNEFN